MEDYVREARKTFNTYATAYEERTKDYIEKHIQKEIDLFLSLLPGKSIIDMGSGPGRDALYFTSKGFKVLCTDIAEEMLELCGQKGLSTLNIDITNIDTIKKKFDGAWCYTIMHLLPKKEHLSILKKIKLIMKPDGLLFLGMVEGDGEGWRYGEAKYPETRRWYAKYQKEELESLLRKEFRIEFFSRTITDTGNYLNFICRNQ